MPEITLVAHNIRSTHNVGSIFRTADGFGVKKIVLTGYTPYPTYDRDTRLPHISQKITEQIHKTALGAEKLIHFDYYDSLEDWLTYNRANNNLPIVALEQNSASINIREYNPPEKIALLLGEEVKGIETRYLRYCESIVEIPMMGNKESFNVSVATGIALYALSS